MSEPGRYRLTLTIDGTPTSRGWWDSRATADDKFKSAVGTYGRDGTTITLVDTETEETLKSWPARP